MNDELLESERGLIGCLITDPPIAELLVSMVEPRDFSCKGLGSVFAMLLDAHEAGKPINESRALKYELRAAGLLDSIGGVSGLGRIVSDTPNSAQAKYHALKVRRAAMLRRVGTLGQELVDGSRLPSTDPLELIKRVDAVASQLAAGDDQTTAVSIQDATRDAISRIEAASKDVEGVALPTGFYDIDSRIGGFYQSELVILAARPSIGKSAFAAQIASYNARKGRSVLFVSLEMDAASIATRELSAELNVEVRALRSGAVTKDHLLRARSYADELANFPLSIHHGRSLTVRQLRALARLQVSQSKGLSLIVVDYLGLLTATDRRKPRWEQVSEISADLKSLAQELNVPVLALCQLARDAEGNRPSLNQLRDSGSIEQDADVVMLLHRESRDASDAELNIAKNRNGACGTTQLGFDAMTTRFMEPSIAEWSP